MGQLCKGGVPHLHSPVSPRSLPLWTKGTPRSSRGRAVRLPKRLFLQPVLFSLNLGPRKRKNDQNEWKEIKQHHEKGKRRYTTRKTQKSDWRQRQELQHLLMSETKVR